MGDVDAAGRACKRPGPRQKRSLPKAETAKRVRGALVLGPSSQVARPRSLVPGCSSQVAPPGSILPDRMWTSAAGSGVEASTARAAPGAPVAGSGLRDFSKARPGAGRGRRPRDILKSSLPPAELGVGPARAQSAFCRAMQFLSALPQAAAQPGIDPTSSVENSAILTLVHF